MGAIRLLTTGVALALVTTIARGDEPGPSARVDVREHLQTGGTVAYEYTVVNTSTADAPEVTDWAIGLRKDLVRGELGFRPDVEWSDWTHRIRQGSRTSRGSWYVWWMCDASLGNPGHLDGFSSGGQREHQELVDACVLKPGQRRSFVLYTRPADPSFRNPAYAVFFGGVGVFGRARLVATE